MAGTPGELHPPSEPRRASRKRRQKRARHAPEARGREETCPLKIHNHRLSSCRRGVRIHTTHVTKEHLKWSVKGGGCRHWQRGLQTLEEGLASAAGGDESQKESRGADPEQEAGDQRSHHDCGSGERN